MSPCTILSSNKLTPTYNLQSATQRAFTHNLNINNYFLFLTNSTDQFQLCYALYLNDSGYNESKHILKTNLQKRGPAWVGVGCGPRLSMALPCVLRGSHEDPTPGIHLALAPQAPQSLDNGEVPKWAQGIRASGPTLVLALLSSLYSKSILLGGPRSDSTLGKVQCSLVFSLLWHWVLTLGIRNRADRDPHALPQAELQRLAPEKNLLSHTWQASVWACLHPCGKVGLWVSQGQPGYGHLLSGLAEVFARG